MIQIDALPAFSDNYIWVLQDPSSKRCAVVDPGDAAPVLEWLERHPEWTLTDILLTHHHHDHVGGVQALKVATAAHVYGPALEGVPCLDTALNEGDSLEVFERPFHVLHVPGHTLGHIAYVRTGAQPLLFCGDTLFAGGCGRLFEGTPAQMHDSLRKFAQLAPTTKVYCAHEYTLNNLRFAHAVEPTNNELTKRYRQVEAMRERGEMTLPSTLELELATNPFMRCSTPSVKRAADEKNGFPTRSEVEVFTTLRAWKDHF
ncbi:MULTISPECIES: hydroxyacylglutathione hydrolase [Pseudomonas]|uniref:hydroxyacylglutathione hydrolase n=1 Tax=Pseudomonas TaxID=286 RepID=UPI00289AED0A|nr:MULTISPECIES: hydroxyacylglutathione hydrolase [Pseudomonas]